MDGGFAKGTEDMIEIPETPELENISQTLTPAQGFVTSGTRDQFMCFVMDPGNATLRWVTGLQVRPGNDLVVHHAVITQVNETEGNALIAEHGFGQRFPRWDWHAHEGIFARTDADARTPGAGGLPDSKTQSR